MASMADSWKGPCTIREAPPIAILRLPSYNDASFSTLGGRYTHRVFSWAV